MKLAQLSIFEFLEDSKQEKNASFDVLDRMKEILKDYKEYYKSEIELDVLDYSISSVDSNKYMPDGAALMMIYVMLPNHTARVIMSNKEARERYANWVYGRCHHAVHNELAHAIRENPVNCCYSLDEHIQQHFQTIEIDGLKINSKGDPYQVRRFIDKYEW